jgi:acetyltransferase
MVDSPYELMIGARRDPTFGIVIIFGQGGIFVEEKADIAIKMLPLTVGDVDEMIESTNVWRMIRRFKVKGVIKKTILAVAKLMMENPDICSIEFNPFKVLQRKIIAVDINIGRENG